MRRREFITLIGGAVAAWPLAAGAQQQRDRVRRIGVLLGFPADDPEALTPSARQPPPNDHSDRGGCRRQSVQIDLAVLAAAAVGGSSS